MSTETHAPSRHRFSPWQLLFLLLGVLLLGVLIARVGWRALLAQAVGIGWYFAASVAVFGVAHLMRVLSWRLCLNEAGRRLSLRSLAGFWLAGEALSNLSVGWSGEAFRIVTTRKAVSFERALSAQLVARALYVYASLVLVTLGLILAWWTLRLEDVFETLLLVATLVSLAVLLLATAALFARGRVLAPLTRRLERLEQRHPLLDRLLKFLRVLEDDLAALVGSNPRLLALLGQNLIAAAAGVVEVYLVLRGLGAMPTWSGAFVIESLQKLLSVFAYVVPGNVGVREGGTILMLKLFSLPALTGLNLALIRRARALVWVAVGALVMVRHGVSPLGLTGAETPGRAESAAVTHERVSATKM